MEQTTNAEKFWGQIIKNTCIEKMTKGSKNVLKNIIFQTYNYVETQPRVNHIDFTPHGESHLKDLYRIISTIFIEPIEDNAFTDKELLILNLSVYFHDFGMYSYEQGEAQRAKHAYTAFQFVKEQLSIKPHDLKELGGVAGLDCIAQICGAHSDANDGHSEIAIDQVEKENNSFIGRVRVLLLAVILRIADELDICCDRINDVLYADPKKDASPEILESHYKHWQKCELFKCPEYDLENNSVKLIVQTKGFVMSRYIKSTYSDKFDLIIDYIQKLYGFKTKDVKVCIEKILNGESIELQSNITQLLRTYKNEQEETAIKHCKNLRFFIDFQTDDLKKWCQYNYKYLNEQQDALFKILGTGKKGHIIEHKILHYLDAPNIIEPCIYDYINFHKIIDTGEQHNEIVNLMYNTFGRIINDIKSGQFEGEREEFNNQSLIIGIDSIGSILAVMLASKLNIPVLPYASSSRSKVYPHIEINDDITNSWYKDVIKGKKNIFIVCDTIYSFDSIGACLEKTGLFTNNENIEGLENKIYIFSLFDRRPVKDDDFLDTHNRKRYYRELKSSFKIFSIIENQKTNFVKHNVCIFCKLKQYM